MNTIEKTFHEEVREKKLAASGVHGKTGKRGYVGTVKTPADLLKGKKRKEYEGTSPVSVSSIYDEVVSLDEFKALSRNKKMIYLHEYRKRFTAKNLADMWGISDKTVYYYFRSYGMDKSKRETSAKKEPAVLPSDSLDQPSLSSESNQPSPDACVFLMKGDYDGSIVSKKLEGLSLMTMDSGRYHVEIRISEQSQLSTPQ